MRLLLEFKDYNEFNFIKDVVEDIFLSEIDEPLNPVVHRSIITIDDDQITCHDLERREFESDFTYHSYLISFNGRLEKEVFNEISERLESVLSAEFDRKIKCAALQNFPINEFVICDLEDYLNLRTINDFEFSVEDLMYDGMKADEWTSAINLTLDKIENNLGITIWIRQYQSKLGINLAFIKDSISDNHLIYKISTHCFFNSASDLSGRWLQDINLETLKSKISDTNVSKWIKSNLKTEDHNALDKLKDLVNKIKSYNLEFKLDLDKDIEDESIRLFKILREKVFPLFSTKETEKISKLYNQFNKLAEYEIESDYEHLGNYFYLFDIIYRDSHYIFNVHYNLKDDIVKIELKDKDIIEEVPIDEFSQTIYLLLQEN
jgi:hypothetical protein